MGFRLKLLGLKLAVVKLEKISNPSQFFQNGDFVSLTKTADEVSLVIETKFVEKDWEANTGWRAFAIEGPLDFSLVGILNQVLTPLAEVGISVFTLSTFDTDYILVKDHHVELAESVLKKKFEISEE